MAKPTRSNVLLELKWVPASQFAGVKRLIDDFGADRVVVNSFSTNVVGKFHEQYPDVKSALDTNGQISLATRQGVRRCHARQPPRQPDVARHMRSAGVPVYLWTVDTTTGWDRYQGKVTLVLTNKAAGLRRLAAHALRLTRHRQERPAQPRRLTVRTSKMPLTPGVCQRPQMPPSTSW